VRVIAVTNLDLTKSVKKGLFREDLYYRLQVVPLQIPPLRDRRSDIPILIDYFLERVHARNPKRQLSVTRDAMVQLCSYDWPGNVRELENMVERFAILADGSKITTSILPQILLDTTRPQTPPDPGCARRGRR
jgi:DNA-binding NtrC family response regulator